MAVVDLDKVRGLSISRYCAVLRMHGVANAGSTRLAVSAKEKVVQRRSWLTMLRVYYRMSICCRMMLIWHMHA
jgi:hypothetical protein